MKSLERRIAEHSERLDNGCLKWTGATRDGGPVITWDGRTRTLRRVMLNLMEDEDFKIRMNCGDEDCIERQHMRIVRK